MSGAAAEEWRTRKVRDWLLAILRFAVTLDPADRAVVLAMAYDMDRAGLRVAATPFAFFGKTSTEFCNAIADKDDPNRAATLHRHLQRIDDQRLRRAFEAVTEFDRPATNSKAGNRDRRDLWKGC